MTEALAYKYIHDLAVTQAPATKARSMVKALAFLGHVLGVESALCVVKSPRLKGSTWAQYAGKRITEGRSPFMVSQLRLSLAAAVRAEDPVEKLLAGHTVFLVASRLRFFDSQRACEEPELDLAEDGRGFVDVRLGKTKTTNTGSWFVRRRWR